MSVSADAQICYGIWIGEDDFPWTAKKYHYGIDDWWLEETGWEPPCKIFDSSGNWLNGEKPKQSIVDEYFASKNKWRNNHPLPVEEVNAGSCDAPSWILAVPGTLVSVELGCPEKIYPDQFTVDSKKLEAFNAFCEKYGFDEELSWHISAYSDA